MRPDEREARRGRVLVTHPLVEGGLDLLLPHHEVTVADGLEDSAELVRAVANVDALIPLLTVQITDEVLAAARRLKVVANHAVGYDNVDVEAATRRGIFVTNTPGVLTEATADLTWAALLAVVRQVVPGDAMMRQGAYSGWSPTLMLGADMAGKTLGVVGFGAIGKAVARRAAGFEMKVLFTDVGAAGSEVDLGGLITARGVSLDELLQTADFVSLHVPLNQETHHLMDAARLAQMKPGAYLVNTSRGPVVDERALVAHLGAEGIAGAALDVYEQEPAMAPGLAELENVVLLPHLGSATLETRLRMAQTAAKNAHAVLQGEEPPNWVNKEGMAKLR